jgi:hypothetical protein
VNSPELCTEGTGKRRLARFSNCEWYLRIKEVKQQCYSVSDTKIDSYSLRTEGLIQDIANITCQNKQQGN